MSYAMRILAPSDTADPDLITRVAAGDLAALGLLFDRYEPSVKRFVGRLGVKRDDVDDLVQLTFMDVTRAASTFDGRSSAKNWLLGLASIVVRRYRRSVARIASGLVAWSREPRQLLDAPAGEVFESHESADRAKRALARISHKKREVFVMFVLEGASGEEIARALGIPVATVWTRLHGARHDLRRSLAEEAR